MEPSPPSSRLTWLAVCFGAGACALLAVVGADARWLAALGRHIVQHGAIPAGVPYAAASSSDWVNVPVLGELVFHGLQLLGGDRALLMAQLVATTTALALLALDMRASRTNDAAGAVVILTVLVAAAPAFLIARSQLFSLPLFAFTLFLLRAEARSPSRRIWLLVPVFALWSNLHGAVLVGVAVAAAYLALHRFAREPIVAAGVLAASVVALFLTPALQHTSAYYLGVMRSEAALRGDGLWAPLSIRAPFDLLFMFLAVPLVWFAWRSRLKAWELLCVAAFTIFTVNAGRNSVWLAFIVAAPAARGFGERHLRGLVASPRIAVLCSALPVALLVGGILHTPPPGGASARVRHEAVALADGQPILADGFDAERLALDGERVWIANPLDAFSHDDQRLYLEWIAATPEGDALLRGPGRVVLVTRGSPSERRVARDPAFARVTGDAKAVLYVRTVQLAAVRTARAGS